ncbi:MAG TPA: RNase H family protein [Candidatus Paceibacterota bacterium]|nr:RNase H family protein [Candidatus Paceibacterota bacterium]
MKNGISVYTDGSSLGNPGPGGWGAVVLWGKNQVKEIGGREEHTTNNKMELRAVEQALSLISKSDRKDDVKLSSDSKYFLQGISGWIFGWQKNGWKTKTGGEVSNREIWEAIFELKSEMEKNRKLTFEYVPGHVKHPGNERADTIARSFAEGKNPKLFEGKIDEDVYDEKNLLVDEEALRKRKAARSRSSQKAYSYLSLVDGILQKHQTWTECEVRVRGVRGAKFRKATSREDEENILKEWGVK